MKIRAGFVSNSSSTSFCIVGCIYTEEQCDKVICDNMEKLGLDSHQTYQDSDELIVGMSLTKIAELDVKYSEFKKIVESKLAEAGLEIGTVSIHEGGWYNG